MFDDVTEDDLFSIEQENPRLASASPPQQQHTPALPAPQGQQTSFSSAPLLAPSGPPTGASPDGIGDLWSFGPGDLAGPIPAIEPTDTSSGAAARSAGFTALAVTAAVGGGIAAGGAWGGAAGGFLAGTVTNAYRAQKWWGSNDPSEKHEAVVSGIMTLVGLGLGVFSGYKAYQSRADGGGVADDDDDD